MICAPFPTPLLIINAGGKVQGEHREVITDQHPCGLFILDVEKQKHVGNDVLLEGFGQHVSHVNHAAAAADAATAHINCKRMGINV